MATHKAELILEAVEDLLQDLDTTGSSVERARVRDWPDDQLPGISIFMGSDVPVGGETQNFMVSDWNLTVHIEASCKKLNYAEIDTTLNAIRAEVTTALMNNPQLGTSFVIDTTEDGANEPELSGEGEKPSASQRFTFEIKYRRSNTDPRT